MIGLLLFATGAFVGSWLTSKWHAHHEAVNQPTAIDIGFAQSMITHHAQAVHMATFMRQAESPAVRSLARGIEISQTREIGLMQGWLSAWRQPVLTNEPAMRWVEDAQNVKDLADQLYAAQCRTAKGKMPGLATTEQLQQLATLQGYAKEQLFLELMLAHHEAALPMARFAMNQSQLNLTKDLAYTIIKEQRAEIALMQQQLAMVKSLVPEAPPPTRKAEQLTHNLPESTQ